MLKVFNFVHTNTPIIHYAYRPFRHKHRQDRSSSRRTNLTVKYRNKNFERFTGEFWRHLCAFLCGEIERKLLHLKFVVN